MEDLSPPERLIKNEMRFMVSLSLAARSYDAVDTIQTGIGTFNERFWARILSADSTNVGVVLAHLVQRLDIPRRTLPFGVQLDGYRLHRLSCRLLVEHLPQEECRVRVHDVLLPCPVLLHTRRACACCTVRVRRCSPCLYKCSATVASCSTQTWRP